MFVRVTEEDIREGIPGDPCRCAIARALSRVAIAQAGREVRVEVDGSELTVDGLYFSAPDAVDEFVGAYDSLPRLADGRPDLASGVRPPEPIALTVPDFGDKSWKKRCDWCDERFPIHQLDAGGLCVTCREESDYLD